MDELVGTSNTAIGIGWIVEIGVKLADHKTDIFLVSSRKKFEFYTIKVVDQALTSKQEFEYLGVKIYNKLMFREHPKVHG